MAETVLPYSTPPFAQFGLFGNAVASTINTVDVWEYAKVLAAYNTASNMLTLAEDETSIYVECPNTHCGWYNLIFTISGNGTNNNEYQFAFFSNAGLIEESLCSDSQAVQGSTLFAKNCLFHLEEGDKIRGAVRNITGDADITIEYATLMMIRA